MSRVCRESIVQYSQEQMYKLVADVSSYRDFLPWCNESHVKRENEDGSILVELGIRHKGISLSFSTLNRNFPCNSILMEFAEGPFKQLKGEWLFVKSEDSGCLIKFYLDYKFSNFVYEKMFGMVFERLVASLVNAFLKRAKQVYG